jgi:predicted SAM-dependent methyltransferase
MVFEEYLERNSKIHLGAVIDELLLDERNARKKLFEFFRQSGILYVDTLPSLKRSVRNELYVRSDRDMHPGKNGYKVIAEAVGEYLTKSDMLH